MKLSVNKAKLSGLWTRNCADIPQVWNLKFAFRPKKVSWHFKKWAPEGILYYLKVVKIIRRILI